MKPIILVVDDEPEVLRAVERDLRREYGERFRILAADSGATALETVRQLKVRNRPVALFLVDQRMPEMTGVAFLEEAIDVFPEAKRVLLTAYSDIDAAIRAINVINIDYYLLKPWDPPEEQLYPVLDDVLDDWMASYRPPFTGVRIVGTRWSPATHQLKDFLARNQVPFQWLDVEADAEAQQLVEYVEADSTSLPLVFFADGTHLAAPANIAVAEKIGLRTRAERPFYDLIIVGAGPAGLAAAVYGASEGLHTVVIECEAPGGQAGTSARIENYLGFPSGLSGADLARRAVTQARRLGAEILTPREAVGVRVEDPYRIVELADGTELSCHTLLIATGVAYRRLHVPGVDRLTGAGVYYGAALTEARSYRDQDVYLVGGANSAGQAAVHFAKHCRSVTMLVRGDSLEKRMSQYLVDQIYATENIKVRLNTTVVEVGGETHLETVTVLDAVSGEMETLPTTALFIFIGAKPHTDWLDDIVARDQHGFILLAVEEQPANWPLSRDPLLFETTTPGIFVAGDVRRGSAKRVATAVGEGAMAVRLVHQHLATLLR